LYTSYNLGSTVALSGDGRYMSTRSHAGAVNGSVYIFSRDNGAWNQVAHLREVVAHSSGGFGFRIDLDATGDAVVLSSPYDVRAGYAAGALFLFRKGAVGWSLESEMFPPPGGVQFELGRSVAINAAGDKVFASSPGYTASQPYAGAVFEFQRTATGAWNQHGVYYSTQPEQDAFFGRNVCSSATGSRFVAAEWTADYNGIDTGRIHIFESPCAAPQRYCTAQTNSLGCLPQIDWQGSPSASSTSGFQITASNVRNQTSGIFFYGTDGANAQPWNGGTLCVRPPLRRTPVQSTGGSAPPAVDCTGALGFDFNTWVSTDLDPALFAGQHVFAQYLSRDSSPTTQVNVTDAVEFYLTP
jgi:hypothetical protein